MLLIHKTALALALLTTVTSTVAAPIVLNGDHFSVTYDDAQVGLYGAGSLSGAGDTLFFVPSTFTAFSGVAGNAASTSASLQLSFVADPGYAFAGLNFVERGDYLLFGGGQVDVAASVAVENTATSTQAVLNLSPGAPLVVVGAPTHNWDFAGSLSLLGLGAPQALQITLDNTLFASTPTAGLGFIEKKFVGFQLQTQRASTPADVPEPASWTLLLAGLLAALLAGRSRGVCAGSSKGVLFARIKNSVIRQ